MIQWDLKVISWNLMGFYGDFMRFNGILWWFNGICYRIYPLVIYYITMDNGPVERKSFPIIPFNHNKYPMKSTKIRWMSCENPPVNKLSPFFILLGGIPTPLKNMSSSIGMMTFPISGKMEVMFQSPPNSTMFIC